MNVQHPPEAARAFRRIEDRLKAALDTGRVATWEWDPQTDTLTADALDSLFGLSAYEAGRATPRGLSLVHPEDREAYADTVSAAVRNASPWQSEHRILRPSDGRTMWVEERAQPVRNLRTGRLTMLGVVWEITERKRVEAALRESESRYRALFDSIDDGFCIQNVVLDEAGLPVDLRYVEVNRAFERITGLTNVAGRTARDLLLDVHASWLRAPAEVAFSGEPIRFEAHVAAWDRWFDIYCVRIGLPSELKVASVLTDVTERRRAEERLRRAAEYDAFRVALNDALRPHADPLAIQSAATRLLGERLQASRVLYAEVERRGDGEHLVVLPGYEAGVAPHPRSERLAEAGGTLLDEMRAGRGIVVRSVEAERRFTTQEREAYFARHVRAFIELPLIKGGRLVAILSVQQDQPREWTPNDVARVEETAQRTWAAVERARSDEALRRAREELEVRVQERTRDLAQANSALRAEIGERHRAEQARNELLRQLVNAQEVERRRISRELHDELGQQVSALVLKLAMMRQDASLPPAARAQVESLEKIARKTDGDLDFLVWQLRPTVLDDLGLVAALRDYVDNWAAHFGVGCAFVAAAGDEMRFDPEIETVLYRFAQEALNNAAKHAHARHVEVRLERGATHVAVCVSDDGAGFDTALAARSAKGLGLLGMRERAQFVGGEIFIQSKPGEGTRVKVDVPLPSTP